VTIHTDSVSEAIPTTVLLYHIGTAGETKDYILTDGSITYFERKLRSSFEFALIDNLGTGSIRISYNRPALDLSNYTNGAKTLKTGDSFYIEEIITSLKIYFVQNSAIEIVLKSAKQGV
jgi:hypothetical protein